MQMLWLGCTCPTDTAMAYPEASMPETPLRSGTNPEVRARIDDGFGRDVVRVDIGQSDKPASLTHDSAMTLQAACAFALEKQLPLVATISSTGADITAGVPAVHGWGSAARAMVRCSGIVPLILIVDGPAVSGVALLLGLADLVVIVDGSYAFVSGPQMVESFTGVPIDHRDLGGSSILASRSGVASAVAATFADAEDTVAELLIYLPSNADELPPETEVALPDDDRADALTSVVPTTATGSYDVRHVIEGIIDSDSFSEVRAAWAANLVTGFALIDGRPVGIVANQPQVLAGTLDIAASQKGGRFVAFCDSFNLPIVTLVDTPGFQPGKDLEWRGMIRHGAELAFAYARATVPRVSLTIRKSYGGAYIVMDSKHMGNDLAFAWPSAEIAVMGAKGAVEILHRRSSEAERAELEIAYENRLLNPYIAAERGSIDAVIGPAESRDQIASALEILASKREKIPNRRHDNTPL